MFRKFLIRIRHERTHNFKDFNIKVGLAFALSAIVSIFVDIFIPFGSGWNLIRTVLLIPLSATIFALMYEWSLSLHDIRVNTVDGWEPYRLRFSRRIRRYMCAIFAAFLFVFVYGFGYRVGYTLVSSCFVSFFIAMAAFIRPTRSEEIREELEIPDERDIRYNNRVAQLEAERLAKRKAKKDRKKKRVVEEEEYVD